jgi:RNA polymerase sigma factor (TIGR02999 family)
VAGAGESAGDATRILRAMSEGDRSEHERLLALVYADLRERAESAFRGERPDHTLQPTVLAHEAWLTLIDQARAEWRDKAQFLGVAAVAMRRILVDHARARQRVKRGGERRRVELGDVAVGAPESDPEPDIVAIDAGLERLRARSERAARVLELRYFGGLSVDEAAEVLGVSEATVRREGRLARAWLARWIEEEREP